MKIKRYGPSRPAVVDLLLDRKILRNPPVQTKRLDLEYDEGIDIVYDLKDLTPEKFFEYSEPLLLAAFTEAERYKEEKWKFAKFVVELNRTAKGRITLNPRRDYIASKHTDADILVYGERALGYKLPEEVMKKPFLINKVREILDMPDTASPGGFLKKQRPYKVVGMIISIRAGEKKFDVSDLRTKAAELVARETEKERKAKKALTEGKKEAK